ncbi:unnamed protein product, partial [Sphacelaria rigidula]
AQSTSTAAQRALDEGRTAATAAQRRVRQLEDHVQRTAQAGASSAARLTDHQVAPPSTDNLLRPHLPASNRATCVIPRKSNTTSPAAAAAATTTPPTPPRHGVSSVPHTVSSPNLRLLSHERQ